MKSLKKTLGLFMAAVLLVSCIGTTAFAAEVPADDMTQVLTAVPDGVELVEVGRATVPGISVGSGRSDISFYELVARATVASGHTAKYVGFVIADRTSGTAASGAFNVSPAIPGFSTTTVYGSSSMQFYEIAPVRGGSTFTMRLTPGTGTAPHAFQLAIVLYEPV